MSLPTLDPAALNARTVSEAISNFYDNLVQIAPDDMNTIRPMLAESWDISPDKRTITLHMRKDATFASGNPVTAEDAAWSIQRVIKLAQVGATDIAAWGYTPENVDRLVRATDADTLVDRDSRTGEHRPGALFARRLFLGIIDKKVALANQKGAISPATGSRATLPRAVPSSSSNGGRTIS